MPVNFSCLFSCTSFMTYSVHTALCRFILLSYLSWCVAVIGSVLNDWTVKYIDKYTDLLFDLLFLGGVSFSIMTTLVIR
jgi:hypothetical protein